MYQVSLKSLLYFQRNGPNKLLIAKIKVGSNSVNTGDGVMVLAFCTFSDGPLSVYHDRSVPFYTFRDMLQNSFLLQ